MDLSVLWQLSYGMYAIGAAEDGRAVGCIVNTVTQITAEDPIISLSMNKNNFTCGAIRRSGSFSVSILSEETRPAAISQLGFFSAREHDKYDGLALTKTKDGLPLLDENCTGWLICDVLSMLDTETHVIFTARVRDTKVGAGQRPMSYRYYHEVIKGKAPKNAPTYRKEEPPAASASEETWVCDICGYVYHGDLTQETDFVCPICKMEKSHFKKR